jgi:hypothetical protein
MNQVDVILYTVKSVFRGATFLEDILAVVSDRYNQREGWIHAYSGYDERISARRIQGLRKNRARGIHPFRRCIGFVHHGQSCVRLRGKYERSGYHVHQ